MKAQKQQTITFHRGQLYMTERVDLLPAEFVVSHFRKPTFKEQHAGGINTCGNITNNTDDLSYYEYCIKSIQMKYTVYYN